jgi:hypothetical protein
MFERDKIAQLAADYMVYASDIQTLHVFLTGYLNGTHDNEGSPMKFKTEVMFPAWQKRVFELYEKFRTCDTMYERTLYGQLLTDFLWNPFLDPYSPTVITHNIESYKPATPLTEAYEWEEGTVTKDTLLEEGVKETFERIKTALTPNRYKFTIDKEGAILIKKNLKADLPDAFRKVNRLLKLYNESGRYEEMKPYLAELYFINELIEMKYLYNHHMTEKEKAAYKDHIDLRSNILSAFKLYLGAVLEYDSTFNFQEFYAASPFSTVLKINREQIKGVRNMLSLVLLGK